MTEFVHEPVKKVIVNDIIPETMENFLYTGKLYGAVSAIWVDGIILVLVTEPGTEIAANNRMDGIRIYEQIIFIKYPKYAKTVKNGGTYELSLRNYSNFRRFRDLAKWIKTQPEWKINPEGAK